jgi:ferritin-like metal-binding protein YciE
MEIFHFHFAYDLSEQAALIVPRHDFFHSLRNSKYFVMEKMINLRDLLVHEIQDLYSAEEQIIEALPSMIEKANNKSLKKALQDHLNVTKKQKDRLDQVKQLLTEGSEEESSEGKKKGFFSRMFGGGSHKCRGTEGLIDEGEKVMAEDMTPEVLDAAIIASAQKIEHYEICGYGTARAYARELNLGEVAELLEETLNEEYQADDLLTDLAVGRLNEKAEKGENAEPRGGRKSWWDGRSNARSNGKSRETSGKSKGAASKSKGTAGKSKGAAGKSSSRTTGSASKSASSARSSNSGSRKATKSGGSGARGGKKTASNSRSKSPARKSSSSKRSSR